MLYYGDQYESVEGGKGERKFGLYGEPKEYYHVVMTMTLYPPELFKAMNDSIVDNLDVEYVSIDDISKSLLESEGTYYISAFSFKAF